MITLRDLWSPNYTWADRWELLCRWAVWTRYRITGARVFRVQYPDAQVSGLFSYRVATQYVKMLGGRILLDPWSKP